MSNHLHNMQFVEPPPPVKAGKATSAAANQKLKDDLYRKLNFPRGCVRLGQRTRHAGQRSRPIEDVRVVGSDGGGKIGVVEKVKDLRTELDVEVFRDPLNVVVLEHGEVHLRYAGAD